MKRFIGPICTAALLLALAATPGYGASVDPIVGKWMWGTRAAEVMADHTATREFGTTGTWKFLEEGGSERTYQFSWENGRLTDDVSLSEDRKTADVRSSLDEKYKATRIGAVPAAALPASGAGAPAAANSEVARAQNERTAKYVKELEALMRLLLEAKTPEFYKAVKAEHDSYADGGKTEGYPRSVSVPGNARILRNVFEADLAAIEKHGVAPRKAAVATTTSSAADHFDIPANAPASTTGPRLRLAAQPSPIAPRNPSAVKGNFFLDVDDQVWLCINGREILQRNALGPFQSPECELGAGDRLTARLHNSIGPRHFILLFVSSDQTKLVSFRHTCFKILPDPQATDFLASDYSRYSSFAKEDRALAAQALSLFPFKHVSDAMWGERDDCSLGCIITPAMFTANAPAGANPPSRADKDTGQGDPMVGHWLWENRTPVEVKEDGTATHGRSGGPTMDGVWKFLNNPEIERQYRFVWNNGEFVDELVLSSDHSKAEVTKTNGKKNKGYKISRAPN